MLGVVSPACLWLADPQLTGKVLAYSAKTLLRQVFLPSAGWNCTCLSRENSSQASILALCRLELYLPIQRKLLSGKYSCSQLTCRRRGCMPKPGSFAEKGHRNRPGWGSGGGGVCLNREVWLRKDMDFADGVHDTMFRRIIVRITFYVFVSFSKMS